MVLAPLFFTYCFHSVYSAFCLLNEIEVKLFLPQSIFKDSMFSRDVQASYIPSNNLHLNMWGGVKKDFFDLT